MTDTTISLNQKPDVENGNIFEFLLGEKPFNGVWFGDDYKLHGLKPYWWRTELRNAIYEMSDAMMAMSDSLGILANE